MSVTKNTFKAERSYALLSSDGAQVLQATDKKSERVPHEIQVSLVFQDSGDFYLPFITERLLHSLSIVCRTIDDRSFRQRDCGGTGAPARVRIGAGEIGETKISLCQNETRRTLFLHCDAFLLLLARGLLDCREEGLASSKSSIAYTRLTGAGSCRKGFSIPHVYFKSDSVSRDSFSC